MGVRTGRRLTTLAVLVSLIAACTDDVPHEPVADLTSIPAGAEAYVVVAPETIHLTRDEDRTILYAFDREGRQLGGIRGDGMSAPRVVATTRSVTVTTATDLYRLTPDGRQSFPMGGFFNGPTAVDHTTGDVTYWFNHHDSARYLTIPVDGPSRTGELRGSVAATGYCGGNLMALTGSGSLRLVSIRPTGETEELTRWDAGQRTVNGTHTLLCTPEHVVSLHTDDDPYSPDPGPLTAIVTSTSRTAPHTRTSSRVTVPSERRKGYSWWAPQRAITLVGDTIVWADPHGDVVSLTPGHDRATLLRRLATPDGSSVLSISGDSLLHVDFAGDVPVYTRHELLTGRPVVGPLRLEWLRDVVGKPAESGQSRYAVVDVTAAP